MFAGATPGQSDAFAAPMYHPGSVNVSGNGGVGKSNSKSRPGTTPLAGKPLPVSSGVGNLPLNNTFGSGFASNSSPDLLKPGSAVPAMDSRFAPPDSSPGGRREIRGDDNSMAVAGIEEGGVIMEKELHPRLTPQGFSYRADGFWHTGPKPFRQTIDAENILMEFANQCAARWLTIEKAWAFAFGIYSSRCSKTHWKRVRGEEGNLINNYE
jgi:hypothetical protein